MEHVMNRPIIHPDARSPYRKYGKTPFHYSAWVREGRDAPEDIQRELRQARNAASNQERGSRRRPPGRGAPGERGGAVALGAQGSA